MQMYSSIVLAPFAVLSYSHPVIRYRVKWWEVLKMSLDVDST